MDERGEVAARHDHQHAGKGQRRADHLPHPHRLAEHQMRQHQREDRAQRHDDAGGGGAGILQSGVDQSLAERQPDAADDRQLERPRGNQVAHLREMVPDDRQQDRAGKRKPPEAQGQGRHSGDTHLAAI